MSDAVLVERTISFVKERLEGAKSGHDWFHIQRVFRNSLLIAREEAKELDLLVVSLGALLHDIADSKFHNGDETVGPKVAADFLKTLGLQAKTIAHIEQIVANISFKNTFTSGKTVKIFNSLELQVVQDADRLDALGAIGIARAFHYGGYKNRKIYDPEIAPNLKMTREGYKKSQGPTINHFYEKLLLLKDKMHTPAGKRLAEERHAFLLHYLEEFYREWNPL